MINQINPFNPLNLLAFTIMQLKRVHKTHTYTFNITTNDTPAKKYKLANANNPKIMIEFTYPRIFLTFNILNIPPKKLYVYSIYYS